MAAEPSKIDALHQFDLHTALGAVGRSVNFTQANTMMLIGGALTLALLYFGMRPRAVVPGRLQAAAEIAYSGLLSMTTSTIGGPEAKRFFPFVFTLFFFVLMGNVLACARFGHCGIEEERTGRAIADLVDGRGAGQGGRVGRRGEGPPLRERAPEVEADPPECEQHEADAEQPERGRAGCTAAPHDGAA